MTTAPAIQRRLALLNHLYLLGMLTVIAAILTAAAIMQYAFGELPCPLCLLQRVAMFGVCFGLLLNLRGPYADRNTGIALAFAILLLVVAERQSLLDIYPRPGHEYIGSAVFWPAHAGVVHRHRLVPADRAGVSPGGPWRQRPHARQ